MGNVGGHPRVASVVRVESFHIVDGKATTTCFAALSTVRCGILCKKVPNRLVLFHLPTRTQYLRTPPLLFGYWLLAPPLVFHTGNRLPGQRGTARRCHLSLRYRLGS